MTLELVLKISYINSSQNYIYMDKEKVYSSDSQIQAMNAKNILDEAGINYFEINKMDTAYAGILGGNIELHVEANDVEKALQLLSDLK